MIFEWVVRRSWIFLLLLTVFIAGSGCAGDGKTSSGDLGTVQQGLVRCADCDEVLDWVRLVTLTEIDRELDLNLQSTLDSWGSGGWVDDDAPTDDYGDDDQAGGDDSAGDDDDDAAMDDDSGEADSDDTGDDTGDSDSSDDYSDTNTQESDVDEADIVKTDGAYLYLLAGGYLLIYDPLPGETTHEISRYDIEGKTHEMFVYENLVVVFSYTHPDQLAANVFEGVDRSQLSYDILVMTVLDISDASLPHEVRKVYFEGRYLSSRRIGSMVRLVVSSFPNGPAGIETWVDPWQFEQDGELDEAALTQAYDTLRAQDTEAVNSAPLEAWLPRFFDIQGAARNMGFLSNCADYFHPLDPMGRAVSSVVSLDLDQPLEKMPDVALLANGTEIYSSSSSLYIAGDAQTAYEWGGGDWYGSMIHKFSLGDGDPQAQYTGSGSVDGFVLNQFSMSESDDGYVRVATSTGWWGELANHIYVLEQRDGELGVVGHIDGIAPGEEIKSARFMGDHGFLVTYEQTDPLFTLNMSNPSDPRIVGELQIPGYSTYLHPYGENHLLTIGQDGDEWGATGGVILQIFDLTDFAHPSLAFKQVVADGWDATSAALNDHKAFLYYAPLNLLAVPLTEYGWDNWTDDGWADEGDWGGTGGGENIEGEEPPLPTDDDDDTWDDDDSWADDDVWSDDDTVDDDDDAYSDAFSGVYVYSVNPANGFTLLGRVDHTQYQPEAGGDTLYDLPMARRSVVIGGYLYTISDAAIVATVINTMEDVAADSLPYENPWDDYWDGGWTDDDWTDTEPGWD